MRQEQRILHTQLAAVPFADAGGVKGTDHRCADNETKNPSPVPSHTWDQRSVSAMACAVTRGLAALAAG